MAEYLNLMDSMYRSIGKSEVDIIGDYFSPNYEQTTANEKIDYSGLVDYIKALMEDAQAIQIYLLKKRSM